MWQARGMAVVGSDGPEKGEPVAGQAGRDVAGNEERQPVARQKPASDGAWWHVICFK